jgi:hypothetical protein
MAEGAMKAVGEEELTFATTKINKMSPALRLLSIITTLMRPALMNRLILARYQAANAEDGTAAVLDAALMVNAEGVISDSLGHWFL